MDLFFGGAICADNKDGTFSDALGSLPEMQSSGPAARLGPELRLGRTVAEPELRMPGSGQRSQGITYRPPGFVRCLKDASWAQCRAHQISHGAGLGSGSAFGELFASLSLPYPRVHSRTKTSTMQGLRSVMVNRAIYLWCERGRVRLGRGHVRRADELKQGLRVNAGSQKAHVRHEGCYEA